MSETSFQLFAPIQGLVLLILLLGCAGVATVLLLKLKEWFTEARPHIEEGMHTASKRLSSLLKHGRHEV